MSDLYAQYGVDKTKYLLVERSPAPIKGFLLLSLLLFAFAFAGYMLARSQYYLDHAICTGHFGQSTFAPGSSVLQNKKP